VHTFKEIRTIAIAVVFLSRSAIAQEEKSKKPSFEVISIKPAPPNLLFRGGGPRGDRLTLSGATLKMLMAMAYRDPANGAVLKVYGEPDWAESAIYDVQAKADCSGGIISSDQLALMIQSLLEDRFQLKAHLEARDMPVYNLVVAKGGPKLKASADQTAPALAQQKREACGPAPDTSTALPPFPLTGGDISQLLSELPRGMVLFSLQPGGGMSLLGGSIPMSRFVTLLKQLTGKDVIDRTELPGLFDITLKFSSDGLVLPALPPGFAAPPLPGVPPPGPRGGAFAGTPVNAAPLAPDPLPTLFSAIQELGLKLEEARGPIQVVVIDSVQKPSEN